MHIKHRSEPDREGMAPPAPHLAPETSFEGVFALPGTTEKVTAELVVRTAGPLARALSIAFTDKATGQPITHFDEALSHELHVLATDSDFSSFVHEHAGKLGPDGRFGVTMHFPKPGTYHVYADAVPTGMGQQVVRFDVPVDMATGPAAPGLAPVGAASQSAGPYTVKLDTSTLQAGTESMMALTILKDGKPAEDLEHFLGVPAHAVFVNTSDLAYVHAHAMAANAQGGSHSGHASHDDPTAAVSSQLGLHATLPHAGRYALWIQFNGGGVTVPAAP
jgi:hypothetical protein